GGISKHLSGSKGAYRARRGAYPYRDSRRPPPTREVCGGVAGCDAQGLPHRGARRGDQERREVDAPAQGRQVMASIERARSARGGYVVRYRGPDRKARTKTFRRKVDATTFLRTIDTDVIRGDYIDPNAGRVTLREFGARWWASSVNLRPSTLARNDATDRNQVLPTLRDVPLQGID